MADIPTPADLQAQIAALTEQLRDITAKTTANQTAEERLETILVRASQAGATAMQVALRTDNPKYPDASVFSYPEGNRARPKPKLTRETHFIGMRIHEDELPPREIELFNALQPGTYHHGQWHVRLVENKLFVLFPNASIDERMALPQSMVAMLAEMVHGVPAQVDPAVLVDRIQELERENAMLLELAELKTGAAA